MSWQGYVDSLKGSGLEKVAIFSADGTSPWATSPGFNITPSELQTVIASFTDDSPIKKIQGEGFHIDGEKLMTLKADDRSVYGKKGKEGIVIVKTKQAILIGYYTEKTQPGAAANTVETMADYLISLGY
ncbi:MAG: profilin, required for normal timing of actin polymerization in response to thermal stress [Vezdaea aestivalis]|nr:MAG: profilin, required for normal timing of actin polymerization in response to thermal stress [Vezdaea aestivalis]